MGNGNYRYGCCFPDLRTAYRTALHHFLLLQSGKQEEKDAKPDQTVAQPAPAPAPVELIDEDENDDEVIAVISAAIAAYTAGDGKTYAIKRIKRAEKQPRSSWGNAGVNENTRSF